MQILLAASDRDLLSSYQKILSALPSETVTAFDGAQVLTLLKEVRFDAVVLDGELPRNNMSFTLERLEKLGTPAIILSNDRNNPPKAIGRAKVLNHPFSPEELVNLIMQVSVERKVF